MPWEKQFDVDQALTKAMEAFWARGYEATSMRDLIRCMGVNRGSIYATFGDKRSLFIQALRRYDETQRAGRLDGLSRRLGPRAAILAAFDGAIETALNGGHEGCFLVNTALELSPHDAEIAGVVAHGLDQTEAFFRDCLRRGRDAGEVAAAVDPVETGRALLSLFLGLRVLARSRPERPLLTSIAHQAAALLD